MELPPTKKARLVALAVLVLEVVLAFLKALERF